MALIFHYYYLWIHTEWLCARCSRVRIINNSPNFPFMCTSRTLKINFEIYFNVQIVWNINNYFFQISHICFVLSCNFWYLSWITILYMSFTKLNLCNLQLIYQCRIICRCYGVQWSSNSLRICNVKMYAYMLLPFRFSIEIKVTIVRSRKDGINGRCATGATH